MDRSAWDRFNLGLDDDQRIIYPEMYKKNRSLYADVCGVVYLVRSRSYPDHGVMWVNSNSLDRLLDRDRDYEDVEILDRLLLVRLRLPWTRSRFEWSMSQSELDDFRDDVEITEIYLKVRRKSDGVVKTIVNKLDFERNRDQYEVLEKRYIIIWKPTPSEPFDKRVESLGIDPDSVHKWLSQ